MINYTKKGTNAENFMQISLLLKEIWYLKDSRNGHFAMHYSSFQQYMLQSFRPTLVLRLFYRSITHVIVKHYASAATKSEKRYIYTKSQSQEIIHLYVIWKVLFEFNWLLNVTCNDISVLYVTANRCAGRMKKKLNQWSGSQRHIHFVEFFNVPVQAPTRDKPFYTLFRETAPFSRILRHAGDAEDTFST